MIVGAILVVACSTASEQPDPVPAGHTSAESPPAISTPPAIGTAAMGMALIEMSLPSGSKSFATPPGWQTTTQGWAALAAVSQARTFAEMAEVADLLRAPVPNTTIVESFNDRVNGQVAVATCDGHQAVIYYSEVELRKFDPKVVQFVREHELSHHRLGQVDCTGPQPRFVDDEKRADCAAIDALRPKGLRARDVVISTASVFYFLNRPAAAPYPAMRERAAYLQDGCGTPLPGG